jgi:hypothetical protein
VLALKSRQVYFSTVAIYALMCFALLNEDANCAIIADTQTNAEALLDRIKEIWLPQLQMPPTINQRRKIQLPNGSKIEARTIASRAGEVSRLGRSASYNFVVISELGVLPDTVTESGWAALQAAIEHSHVVVESTGTNQGKLFKSLYYADNDYYKLFTGVEQHPHYRLQDELGEEEQQLANDLGFTIPQAAAWWLKQLRDHYNNDLAKCLQELPILPSHSFYNAEGSWFTKQFEYFEVPPKNIYLNYPLSCYQSPRDTKYYYGIDVSKGVGGDYSALTIIDQNQHTVASFDNNEIDTISYLAAIENIFKDYPPYAIAVDSVGVGTTLYQQLSKGSYITLEIKSDEAHKYNTLLNSRNYLNELSQVPVAFKRDIENLHVNKQGKFTGYKDLLMSLGYALEVYSKFKYIPPPQPPKGFRLNSMIEEEFRRRQEDDLYL